MQLWAYPRGVCDALDGPDIEQVTVLNRRFPGGSRKVLAAKSPRNLRRNTAKILILDEIDSWRHGKGPGRIGTHGRTSVETWVTPK